MEIQVNANGAHELDTQPLGSPREREIGNPTGIDTPHPALDGCRQYLLLIANEMIGPELQAKFGASDLVQDTFIEAQRHLAGFRGTSNAEMRAWLRSRPCARRRKSGVTSLRAGRHRRAAMQCDRN
jgi:hypothetical protein